MAQKAARQVSFFNSKQDYPHLCRTGCTAGEPWFSYQKSGSDLHHISVPELGFEGTMSLVSYLQFSDFLRNSVVPWTCCQPVNLLSFRFPAGAFWKRWYVAGGAPPCSSLGPESGNRPLLFSNIFASLHCCHDHEGSILIHSPLGCTGHFKHFWSLRWGWLPSRIKPKNTALVFVHDFNQTS